MATLGIDVSALSLPELRRLLEATRARGESALTRRLLDELATRRMAPGAYHGLTIRPDAAAEYLEETGPAVREPRAQGRALPLIVGMAATVLLSAGFGWWLAQPAPHAASPPAAAAPAPVLPTPAQASSPPAVIVEEARSRPTPARARVSTRR
jgi:hypothetical protein